MNVQRGGWRIGLMLTLALACGCNNAKDESASIEAMKLEQDKHTARLAELEAEAKKSESQAARIADLEKQLAALKDHPPAPAQQTARVAELEKQVAALRDREPAAARNPEMETILKEIAAELRARAAAPKPDPEAALKYMRGIAEAFLTATLSRNDQTMAASMTRSYKANIAGEFKEGTPEYFKMLASWCFGRSGGPKESDPAVYQEWKIVTERLAPGAEEASFEGTLSGKLKGTYTLRVVKDKESGKFLVDFFDVKHGE